LSAPSKVSHAAAYAVIVLLVVVGAAFLLNSRLGGIQVYDVYPTGSMTPTIDIGDLVVVHAVPYSDIQVGDVIVYSPPIATGGCLNLDIVHRVVNITSEGLYTQGDNRFTNPVPDEPLEWPPVTPECVKGMVVVALPFLGLISEAFPPPINYILVAAIVVLIFVIELYSGRKEGEKKEHEAAEDETSGGPSGGSAITRSPSSFLLVHDGSDRGTRSDSPGSTTRFF
jgi:signal peptidase I